MSSKKGPYMKLIFGGDETRPLLTGEEPESCYTTLLDELVRIKGVAWVGRGLAQAAADRKYDDTTAEECFAWDRARDRLADGAMIAALLERGEKP